MIINKINKKKYVGQSVDVFRRYGEHFNSLENDTHHNKYLQEDFNKYGITAFGFIILEDLSFIERLPEAKKEVILLCYEAKYMKSKHSFIGDAGYNLEKTLKSVAKSNVLKCSTDKAYNKIIIKEVANNFRDNNYNYILTDEDKEYIKKNNMDYRLYEEWNDTTLF